MLIECPVWQALAGSENESDKRQTLTDMVPGPVTVYYTILDLMV
jgi:hypothetical protein